MSSCINEVILMGNLGHSPELRHYDDGRPFMRVSLATTDKWRDRDSGELVSDTQWHQVLFKGVLAQRVADYLDVGDKLWLRGRLKTRQYTDEDNVVRSIAEVHAREMKMIWSKHRTTQADAINEVESEVEVDVDTEEGEA